MEKTVPKPAMKPPQKTEVPVSVPKSVKPKKKTGKVLYDGEVIIKNEFESKVKCFPSTERKKLTDPQLSIHI